MRGIFSHTLLTNTRSRSRTMMSISHIQRRHIGKKLRQAIVRLLRAHNPEVMTEAIRRRKIIVGLVSLNHTLYYSVNLLIIRICKEHRLDIGLLVANVNHTILLLVGTGKLVFLDRTREVILEVAAHRNSILRTTLHRLRIYIIVLLTILHEPSALLPEAEVLHRLLINLIRMFIGNGIEVNLWLDDVQ